MKQISAALAVLLLCGCSALQPPQEKQRPFKFKKLDLVRSDEQGDPIWQLVSPSTKYQLDQRRTYLTDPVATIFKEGKPAYLVSAPNGLVIDDGRQVEVYGGVKFVVLDDRGIVITADRVFWMPDSELITFEGKPTLVDRKQRVRAGAANFHTGREQLNASQGIQLDQWKTVRSSSEQPSLTINTNLLSWNTGTGVVQISQAIRGIQRPGPKRQRVFASPSMQGNTKEEWYDFQAPVTISEAAEELTIKAGLSRWWAGEGRITSAAPAEGQLKQLNVKGSSLEILQNQSLLKIGSDCQLTQPGDQLTAQRCSWNWDSGAVLAEGDVVLKRDKLKQVTRARRLDGVTGDDGRISFSAPGQQVTTQLQLKDGTPSTGQGPTQRPSAPPVNF